MATASSVAQTTVLISIFFARLNRREFECGPFEWRFAKEVSSTSLGQAFEFFGFVFAHRGVPFHRYGEHHFVGGHGFNTEPLIVTAVAPQLNSASAPASPLSSSI